MSGLPGATGAYLRVAAWNLGHRTRERPIPADFYRAVQLLEPDVLVLNEFKDGTTRSDLRAQLAAQGLRHVLVSTDTPGCNQVLVASRSATELGDLTGPQDPDQHASTNFLHVRHLASGIDVVGLRAPAYKSLREIDRYWQAMAPLLQATSRRRIVFAGDFNVEPLRARSGIYTLFSGLVGAGWHLPQPTGAWSFASGTRIDHVLASPSTPIARCAYVAQLAGLTLASPDRLLRVSDHAPVVADVYLTPPEKSNAATDREPETTSATSLVAQPPSTDTVTAYAAAGSQRWLQVAIAEAPELLNAALIEAGAVDPDDEVEWRSPILSTRFEEYRDRAALRLLGIEHLPVRTLEDFWPNGGPVWDALAVTRKGRVLLLEAKAHIAEAASPASRASPMSLAHIKRSLDEARRHYSPRATADWSGPLYQYGNRLAFQYLLKALNGVDSRLVFLNFRNAPDVRSPETRHEWQGAIELIHALLGLPSDLSRHGVHHAYVDVLDIIKLLAGRRQTAIKAHHG